MQIIKLNRKEYLESVINIEDFKTLNFSKKALEWWDDYYSWEKFPPLCLTYKNNHMCYLFYNISKDNEYLTIHNIFTPNKYRTKGHAYMLLGYLFNHLSKQNIKRFKMYCVSSSLDFYTKLGLEYWGVNNLSQYYCDFKMPKLSIKEIPQIVKDSSLDEINDERILLIFESLKNNGKEFDEKNSKSFESSKMKLKEKYHFESLLLRVEAIKYENKTSSI